MSDSPPYGAYPQPPAAPSPLKPLLVIVLALALVLVVAVAALAAFFLLRDEDDPAQGGPATLRRPVQFLHVRASGPAPCKAGMLPDPSDRECLQVGSGMTIGQVDDIRVKRPDPARGVTGFYVAVSFTQKDAQTFTQMTTTASRAQPPANQIAIVSEGMVLSAPAVATPITGGKVEISGPSHQFTRSYTENLVRRITGR
ncbi:hypothetical protein GCM10010191_86350 [Actinomadura vinacea]|uniref:SecDF P1 head subdomain domain-containing protein n=1 Tax=Actinomadura vinacea TaxID=115336 RepID=A0ABN3KE36_9ACTN